MEDDVLRGDFANVSREGQKWVGSRSSPVWSISDLTAHEQERKWESGRAIRPPLTRPGTGVIDTRVQGSRHKYGTRKVRLVSRGGMR